MDTETVSIRVGGSVALMWMRPDGRGEEWQGRLVDLPPVDTGIGAGGGVWYGLTMWMGSDV